MLRKVTVLQTAAASRNFEIQCPSPLHSKEKYLTSFLLNNDKALFVLVSLPLKGPDGVFSTPQRTEYEGHQGRTENRKRVAQTSSKSLASKYSPKSLS